MELAFALARLCGPQCHAALRPAGDRVACAGASPHTFGSEDGFIGFARGSFEQFSTLVVTAIAVV